MANLKAVETLALEGGKVSPGQVFTIASKEDAAVLIAQGRAEETDETADYEPAVTTKPFITSPKVKQEKEPVKTKEEKTDTDTK